MIFIDEYPVDVAVTFERTREAEVSQWPVEEGADMTDHVRLKQAMIKIEGIISDSPLHDVEAVRTPGVVPSSEAYDKLNAVFEARQQVIVRVGNRTHRNMVFTSLSEPISSTSGKSYRFTGQFTQIEIVTTERAVVKVTLPKAKAKVKIGAKPATPVDDTDSEADAVKSRLKDYAAGRRSAFGDLIGF